ncbi:MAG: alpha-glucosidase C-terminal domain-containing protein, partial [Myxococcales bacterium]|nr:alpha-glucosidase C-terminal domain-containing protein [Myxococcales bacterium]
LPILMDPVYGYQRVNVEAQQRDSDSFLQWLRRMLAIRHEHPVFGTGSFQVLLPANETIYAYVRQDENDTILCVNNLSRRAQAAELDLSAYKGCVPLELLGGERFPPIGDLPYLLTFGPHAFYWFSLSKSA